MPGKKDEPLSRAKKGVSVEEPSSVMEEVSQVETWTAPAREIVVETWTTPAREMTGEIVATPETSTAPARRLTLEAGRGQDRSLTRATRAPRPRNAARSCRPR